MNFVLIYSKIFVFLGKNAIFKKQLTNVIICVIITVLIVDRSTLPKSTVMKGGTDSRLENIRFEKFTLLIDGIHKSISKLKLDIAPTLGVKGVHVFWVYELSLHPEGLTAAEIENVSRIDRSLVSREIETLKADGYIVSEGGGRRRYNERFTLTEKGRELAVEITERVLDIQNTVNSGIDRAELASFYKTLETLHRNFVALSSQGAAQSCNQKNIL